MPGPGDDNITGNNYTLNLGVKPDMAPLIQDLNVANDLLDQAEAKFKSISDIIGTTSQRMGQLTRATQLFVAETQRARNEYQRLSSIQGPSGVPTTAPQVGPQSVIAAGAMASQWGGTGGAMYGLGAMPPPPPGGGPPGGNLPPTGGFGGGRHALPPWVSASMMAQGTKSTMETINKLQAPGNVAGAALQRMMGGFNIGWGTAGNNLLDRDSRVAAQYMPSISMGTLGISASDIDNLIASGNLSAEAVNSLSRLRGGAVTSLEDRNNVISSLTSGGFGGNIRGGLTGSAMGQGLAGRAMGLGAALRPAAMPLLFGTAALYGASTANQMAVAPFMSARNYGAMTGGTAVMGGPGGGMIGGQSAAGYELLKSNLSGEYGAGPFKFDTNWRVSKEEAASNLNAVLASGYSTGGALTPGSLAESNTAGAQALTFLQKQTEQGFTDSQAAMQMWVDVVDTAGGSTRDLTDTMARFREIATQTDVGVQQLVGSFNNLTASFKSAGLSTQAATTYYKATSGGTEYGLTAAARGSTLQPTQPLMGMAAATYGTNFGAMAKASATGGQEFGNVFGGMMATSAKQVFENMGIKPPTQDIYDLPSGQRLDAWITSQDDSVMSMIMMAGPQIFSQFGLEPANGDWSLDGMMSTLWAQFYQRNNGGYGSTALQDANKYLGGDLAGMKRTAGGSTPTSTIPSSSTDTALSQYSGQTTGGQGRGGGRRRTRPEVSDISSVATASSAANMNTIKQALTKYQDSQASSGQESTQQSEALSEEGVSRATARGVEVGFEKHVRALITELRKKASTDWNP